MINWNLYKGRDTERSKKAYIGFCELLENENYKLIGDYFNNRTKIELECDKGHKYSVTPSNFKGGIRCPICSGCSKEYANLEFIKQVESEGYKVIGEYKNAMTKVEVECDKQHRYKVTPNNFKSGKRCPHCGTISHGENLTKEVLKEYNCRFETQKKFDGLVGLNGGQLSYDFFVDNYLLIEIQGEQHYKPKELFGGEEQFKKQLEHDRRKRDYAKEHGYELLEIPYFGRNKLEILERMLRDKIEDYKHIQKAS